MYAKLHKCISLVKTEWQITVKYKTMFKYLLPCVLLDFDRRFEEL